jgi:hypothetical protein
MRNTYTVGSIKKRSDLSLYTTIVTQLICVNHSDHVLSVGSGKKIFLSPTDNLIIVAY